MKFHQFQNSLQQESTSSETQKKPRRKRRYGRKSKSVNSSSGALVTTDPNIINPSKSANTSCGALDTGPNILSLIPNSFSDSFIGFPIEPELFQRPRTYNSQKLLKETNTIDNSSNSSVSKGLKETFSDYSFSNNISRSYMDKMKREDDAKSRESVLAEREGRRLAKQKVQDKSRNLGNTSPTKSVQKQEPIVEKKIEGKVNQTTSTVTTSQKLDTVVVQPESKSEKSREEVIAEREAKKQAKLAKKTKTTDTLPPPIQTTTTTEEITKKLEKVTITEKPILSKAERREKQEAQRAAKAKLVTDKDGIGQKSVQSTEKKPKAEKVVKANEISVRTFFTNCFSFDGIDRMLVCYLYDYYFQLFYHLSFQPPTKKMVSVKLPQHKVKLFNHLYADKGPENILNSNSIHPAIVKLGAQYANGNIVGSNARCIAFMERIKKVLVFSFMKKSNGLYTAFRSLKTTTHLLKRNSVVALKQFFIRVLITYNSVVPCRSPLRTH